MHHRQTLFNVQKSLTCIRIVVRCGPWLSRCYVMISTTDSPVQPDRFWLFILIYIIQILCKIVKLKLSNYTQPAWLFLVLFFFLFIHSNHHRFALSCVHMLQTYQTYQTYQTTDMANNLINTHRHETETNKKKTFTNRFKDEIQWDFEMTNQKKTFRVICLWWQRSVFKKKRPIAKNSFHTKKER